MTDAHAHLDACDAPVDALVERARASGVTRIVTIGTGIGSGRAALEAADRHAGVYAALGIHPHEAAEPEAARIDELRELLRHPKVVAVGETGLDTVRGLATAAQQRRLFDAHLGLADELKLPVVVHNREADDEAASALAGFSGDLHARLQDKVSRAIAAASELSPESPVAWRPAVPEPHPGMASGHRLLKAAAVTTVITYLVCIWGLRLAAGL